MAALETIAVVRESHPDGYTVINKSDMTEADVIFNESDADEAPKEGTVPWLIGELESLEVEIPEGMKKADLELLLKETLEAD